MVRKCILFLIPSFLLLPGLLLSQADSSQRKYTAFDMRSNGKIYVVVVVVLIILIGLILYLVRLDRKITRLEKEK
jgi:heme export protein D (CcmD)